MYRVHNFSAGPATLPVSVIQSTQRAVTNYNDLGMSILEMSHRSKEIVSVFDSANANILEIMGLSSSEYAVLFLGGGASTQFAMIPMNFLSKKANYINTGTWANKSIKEAKLVGEVNIIASSKESNFNFIPKEFKIDSDADYMHYTSNNTIFGTQWNSIPDCDIPLVCDMSSDIFSRVIDYSKFDLIYAGAQKNIGPAGATVVVLKKSWLAEKGNKNLMTMFNYQTHIDSESMFNTPPVLPVYVINETLKWIKEQGGVQSIEKMNKEKAEYIYDTIEASSGFYIPAVPDKEDRSYMNVTFNLKTPELEKRFVENALKYDLSGLKGHRSVGGIRASIYNACPMLSVEALVNFMDHFLHENWI